MFCVSSTTVTPLRVAGMQVSKVAAPCQVHKLLSFLLHGAFSSGGAISGVQHCNGCVLCFFSVQEHFQKKDFREEPNECMLVGFCRRGVLVQRAALSCELVVFRVSSG